MTRYHVMTGFCDISIPRFCVITFISRTCIRHGRGYKYNINRSHDHYIFRLLDSVVQYYIVTLHHGVYHGNILIDNKLIHHYIMSGFLSTVGDHIETAW
jgi:hypothetical protein